MCVNCEHCRPPKRLISELSDSSTDTDDDDDIRSARVMPVSKLTKSQKKQLPSAPQIPSSSVSCANPADTDDEDDVAPANVRPVSKLAKSQKKQLPSAPQILSLSLPCENPITNNGFIDIGHISTDCDVDTSSAPTVDSQPSDVTVTTPKCFPPSDVSTNHSMTVRPSATPQSASRSQGSDGHGISYLCHLFLVLKCSMPLRLHVLAIMDNNMTS